jgi:hypothetical protein
MAERIVLTDHAIEEARRRGINKAIVLQVATTPLYLKSEIMP